MLEVMSWGVVYPIDSPNVIGEDRRINERILAVSGRVFEVVKNLTHFFLGDLIVFLLQFFFRNGGNYKVAGRTPTVAEGQGQCRYKYKLQIHWNC